mmetsp:Transcript_2720/g.5166  ORF Transcript_2720/g.5166 Transcript_2720/m.5166 type:complete len:155 (-) Transcript_2720:29-493(-)
MKALGDSGLRFVFAPVPALLFSSVVGAGYFAYWGTHVYSYKQPFFIQLFLIMFIFIEIVRAFSGTVILASGSGDGVMAVFALILVALCTLLFGTLVLLLNDSTDLLLKPVRELVQSAWWIVLIYLVVTIAMFFLCVAATDAKRRSESRAALRQY